MAEAVENSLQYLRSEDISALVAYLRTVTAQPGEVNTGPARVRRSPRTNSAATFSKADALTVINIAAMAGRRSMPRWLAADR